GVVIAARDSAEPVSGCGPRTSERGVTPECQPGAKPQGCTANPPPDRCRIFAAVGADLNDCHVTPDLLVLRSPGTCAPAPTEAPLACRVRPAAGWLPPPAPG